MNDSTPAPRRYEEIYYSCNEAFWGAHGSVPGCQEPGGLLLWLSWAWVRVPVHGKGLLGLHFLQVPGEGAEGFPHQLAQPWVRGKEKGVGLEHCEQSNIKNE